MSKQTNDEISRRTFLGQTSLLAGGLALRASTAGAGGPAFRGKLPPPSLAVHWVRPGYRSRRSHWEPRRADSPFRTL